MKRLLWCVAVLLVLGFTFSAYALNTQAIKEAVAAEQAGAQLTPAQKAALEELAQWNDRNRTGDELDRTGGPDGFGYSFIDSEEDNGPVFDWVDISATGTLVNGLLDDNFVGPFDIDFDFPFYTQSYDQFWVQSNGVVSFSGTNVSLANYEMPYANGVPMIAWFWDDLNPGNGGTVYYETLTVQDQTALVIQFQEYHQYSPADGYATAEIILFEDGEIILQYSDVNDAMGLTSCTIGIQNEDGDVGLTYLYNGDPADYPYSELAILFFLPEPDASVEGTVTDVDTGDPLEGVEVSVGGGTATTDDTGYYFIDDLYSGLALDVTGVLTGYNSYQGQVTLEAGENTYDFSMEALPPPQASPYFDDFEEDQGWFETGPTAVDWQWGEPTIDPENAYSPTHAWDTVLNGNYENNSTDSLFTTTSWLVGDATASVSYWHWFDLESGWDGYNFHISTDGGQTWSVLEPDDGYSDPDGVFGLPEPCFTGSSGGWAEVTYSLADYVDEQVMFMFYLGTDASVQYPGIAFDDFFVDVPELFGTLTGTVTESGTGDPINLAEIEVLDGEGNVVGSAISDGDGIYTIEDLMEGTYTVDVWAEDYIPETAEGVEIIAGETTTLDFELDFIPTVTIEDIQTVYEVGDWVATTGIVTQPTNSTTSSNFDAYIQDETGYGVKLFAFGEVPQEEGLNRGDEITVVGRIDEYNGVTELMDFEFVVLSTDNDMPEPLVASTGDMANNQDMEGSWAQITGPLAEDPPNEGSYTLYIDDGSGEVQVRIWENAALDLSEFVAGDVVTFNGVIGLYQDNVQIVPSLQEDISGQEEIFPPTDLAADLNEDTGEVTLTWSHEGGGYEGEIVELIYDDGEPGGGYNWVGSTMNSRMSPDGPCQVLALKYYTFGADVFAPRVFPWEGDAPGNDTLYNSEVTALDNDWTEVDVSDANLTFNGDFVVGFGGLNQNTSMGFDADDNNGRSWDYSGGNWSQWDETYFIRAIVQYQDGMVAELTPVPVTPSAPLVAGVKTAVPLPDNFTPANTDELDEFIEFIVYRDGEELGRTTEMTYIDQLPPEGGTFSYTVTALYDAGESDPAGPVEVTWDGTSVGETSSGVPTEWAVSSVYPNPFNPAVNIVLAVPQTAGVRVEIVNLLGRQVAVLNDGRLTAGYHTLSWQAVGNPSGLYFLRVSSDTGFNAVEKLMFIK